VALLACCQGSRGPPPGEWTPWAIAVDAPLLIARFPFGYGVASLCPCPLREGMQMDTLQFFEQTHQRANAADAQSAQAPPRRGGGF